MMKKVTLYTDDGEEEVEFPAKWEVCWDCQGKGTTYLGWTSSEQPAFTQEDFEREDPDFKEEYVSGHYDKQCPTCEGRTTTLELDEEACKQSKYKEKYEAFVQQEKDDAEYEAIRRAERRMGA
jgi:hypothetical protein